MRASSPERLVFRDVMDLDRAGAEQIFAAIGDGGERPAVCLTGGSSVIELYRLLAGLGSRPDCRGIVFNGSSEMNVLSLLMTA